MTDDCFVFGFGSNKNNELGLFFKEKGNKEVLKDYFEPEKLSSLNGHNVVRIRHGFKHTVFVCE